MISMAGRSIRLVIWALDSGNFDEVDALERNCEWLHYM